MGVDHSNLGVVELAYEVLVVTGLATRSSLVPQAIDRAGLRMRPAGEDLEMRDDAAGGRVIAIVCDSECPGLDRAARHRFAADSDVSMLVVAEHPSPLQAQQALAAGADAIIDLGTEPDYAVAQLAACLKRARERADLCRRVIAAESWVTELGQALVDADRYAAFGRLLGGIVHRLRTPLATAIFVQGEVAETLPAPVSPALELALSSLDRALHRMATVLASLAARAARDLDASVTSVDLNAVVKAELAFLAVDPRIEHRVRQELDLTDRAPVVAASAREISHLVGNCVLYTLAVVRDDPCPTLKVRTSIEDGSVSLRVHAVPSVPGRCVATPCPSACDPRGPQFTIAVDVVRILAARNGGELQKHPEPDGSASLILWLPLAPPEATPGAV